MTFSKKSILFFLFISLTFSFLFGQTAASNSAASNSVDSNTSTEMVNESEISLSLPDSNGSSENSFTTGKRKSSVWPFIKMILALLLVVAAIYGVLFFVRKKANPAVSDDNFLRRVAYLNLGQGKSVEVVTLVDKGAYLLGVTEGGINLIAEVKDEELIQAMNLYSDKQKNVTKPRNFSDILEIFMPGGPRDDQKTNIYNSSVNNPENLFQNQTQSGGTDETV